MTKIEKLLEGIQGLKAKGYDADKIDALTEGINLIADEYRKRKAREQRLQEATGFEKLDGHLMMSGLSRKAFVESVGKTILESKHSDSTKTKMIDTLGKYAAYLESDGMGSSIAGCIFSCTRLDEDGKEMLANGDVYGLMHKVALPNSEHKYRDAATATIQEIEDLASGKTMLPIDGRDFKVTRKLIDSSQEKLLVLGPADGQTTYGGEAYLLHCANTPTVNYPPPKGGELHVLPSTPSLA